jgi:hypothetical protein
MLHVYDATAALITHTLHNALFNVKNFTTVLDSLNLPSYFFSYKLQHYA